MGAHTTTRRLAWIAIALLSCTSCVGRIHVPSTSRERPPVGAARVPQPIERETAALTLELSAYIAPEPADVDVRMRLEHDARSRALTIEWWNADGVGGSHLISLEGEQAARAYDYTIKRVIAGEYVVAAVLQRSDGSIITRRRRLIVERGDPSRADSPK